MYKQIDETTKRLEINVNMHQGYYTKTLHTHDGRFPDSLGASAKKVNDAMHRFKNAHRLHVGICIAINCF